MKRMLTAFACSFIIMKGYPQAVISLYDGNLPNSRPSPDDEYPTYEGENKILIVHHVSRPSLTVFPADKKKANGTAVIICPGGGYSILAASHEGYDVAKKLNEWGIAAFVLKYRIPDDKTMVNKEIGPLQDAQRAIQMVRENAKEWGIDPGKIGIMGFSAGGHLASTAGTHFTSPVIDNKKNTSLRPDFMILVYPVISFTDSIGHIGSRDNLLGKNPSPEKIKEYSNELQVNAGTPPAFLVHAGDDDVVKVQNSIYFYEAEQRNKLPAALHIYPHGGHGFGMNNPTTKDQWMERLRNWLPALGF
ncbi:MAG: alpha/beta hydrolase [Bacteroidetes bacterium]|nr:alpha/beta hydrolase [Bacteroidota bacterium]MBS1974090.1 alpha/beta hydrolase [Bacteroidota bacterium]